MSPSTGLSIGENRSSVAPARQVLPALLRLAWPIASTRAIDTAATFLTVMMTARLGEVPLAAVTTGALNMSAVLALPAGLVAIVTSFSSQLRGRGDLVAARRHAACGLVIAAATGLCGFAAVLFAPSLPSALPGPPELQADMTAYVRIRLLASGVAIAAEALAAHAVGLGDTRRPLAANLVGAVVQISVGWLLIGGHLGAPVLGAAGAALASAAGSGAALVLLGVPFLVDGRASGGWWPGVSRRELVPVLRFGLPLGLHAFFDMLSLTLFVDVVLAGLGTTTLAAAMSVDQINSVTALPAIGLAEAAAVLVGQAIGRLARNEVPSIVKATLGSVFLLQILVSALYLTIPTLLFAPFARDAGSNPAFWTMGLRLLAWSAVWQLFEAGAMTLAAALRAAGDTVFPFVVRLTVAWAIFVPGAYMAARVWGWRERGAILWLIVDAVLVAGILLARFRRGRWRRIALIRSPSPVAGGPIAEEDRDRLL